MCMRILYPAALLVVVALAAQGFAAETAELRTGVCVVGGGSGGLRPGLATGAKRWHPNRLRRGCVHNRYSARLPCIAILRTPPGFTRRRLPVSSIDRVEVDNGSVGE